MSFAPIFDLDEDQDEDQDARRLEVLAGHRWEWRDRRPVHLASCECWALGAGSPLLAPMPRPFRRDPGRWLRGWLR